MRDVLIHRAVAAALIGRDLNKSEEVHHRDGNRLNFHWANLIVMGQKDHGWVSARQAWYMREKDKREKKEWDEFMAEKENEFRDEVAEARAAGEPWRSARKDGKLQQEWEGRAYVSRD